LEVGLTGKRALITGITGQDGSYLAEFLLEQGYHVIGMLRRSSSPNFEHIERIRDDIILVSGDLMDQASLVAILESHYPSEVYNLAAQSSVHISWEQPVLTGEVTALGVTRLLDAVMKVDPNIRYYQASSSEMFGKVREYPLDENTKFCPSNPYGVAKLYGHWITVNYRESYGLYACSGICFNHESPRRGPEFVTRKIVRGSVRIKSGLDRELRLGNLGAQRDWGYAPDFVRAMWLMLQQDEPDDYVLATGETYTIQQFVEISFGIVGLNWRDYVVQDTRLERPVDVDLLVGDPSKAREKLGWQATTTLEEVVEIMVKAEFERMNED
jgi:GDPmannose 4,6-dehydratase